MTGKVRQFPHLEVHTHAYVGGGQRGSVEHSHEGGSTPHYHPHTGPSHFSGRGTRKGPKFVTRATGPQLDYIERPAEESTFRVIFVDEYTDGHASAGISRERWEEERDYFLAGGQAPAVERMVNEFGLTPIFVLDNPHSDE